MIATQELLDTIKQEEAELVLPHFDEHDAWRLGTILVEMARNRQAPVAIDIRRPGQTLFHAALPGATPDNDEWIRRKSNVVFRFGKASFAVGISLALADTTIDAKYYVSPLEYSPHGGAFPIRVTGAGIVACATVSGLPQEEDHKLVVTALRQYLSSTYP
ncbi:heme-degrading domain-containing protein [Gracilinema caldarium]|uniref:UPF0303 protein Spica_0119 n=1 Tax=Gracilinema caldarium (strain ATCC 51460 / DSM 7334 / H1) TaxID=744872 RepID=F8EYC8_GRAC1|nr:heme-degrading domain-containing protein [Gracilinema caldarium]AEJ18287.1 UPF0303 protein [Gracilinema caldarium DSM 7334]